MLKRLRDGCRRRPGVSARAGGCGWLRLVDAQRAAGDRRRLAELDDAGGLDELAAAVDGAAHGPVLVVEAVGPGEVLEAERRAEGGDEEDAVGLGPGDREVVALDVGALGAAVAGHERHAVDDREALEHRLERLAGGRDAGLGVLGQQQEGRNLVLEALRVDAALLADRARGEPPGGLGVGVHRLDLAAHLLDGLLGVGGVEDAREALGGARDEVQRAGDAGVEAGGGAVLARDALREAALRVDVAGPGALLGDAAGVLGDVGGEGGTGGVGHGKTSLRCSGLMVARRIRGSGHRVLGFRLLF